MLLEDIELHINQIATRKAEEFQKYHNNLELICKREQRRIKKSSKERN